MKFRTLLVLSVFFFLIVSPACAAPVSHTGEIDTFVVLNADDVLLSDYTSHAQHVSNDLDFKYRGESIVGHPGVLKYYNVVISVDGGVSWDDIPQNVGGSFSLDNGGSFAGDGSVTIHKTSVSNFVDITFDFEFDSFVPAAGETIYTMDILSSVIDNYYNNFYFYTQSGNDCYAGHDVMISRTGVTSSFGTTTTGPTTYASFFYKGNFVNEYNITLDGATAVTVINRTGVSGDIGSSRLIFKDSDYVEVFKEVSYQSANTTTEHYNGEYYYYIDIENGDVVCIHSSVEGDAPLPGGSVSFNKSYYVSPERVGVDYIVDDFDLVGNEYYIVVSGTNDVDGVWSSVNMQYQDVLSSSGQVSVYVNRGLLTLPVTIRAELWRYDKDTGLRYNDAVSSHVIFNPLTLYGNFSLSVNDTSYEIGDTIQINYSISDFYEGKLYLLNPSSVSMIETVFEEGTYSDNYYLDPGVDGVMTGNWLVVLHGRMSSELPFGELDSVNPVLVTSSSVEVNFGRDVYDVNSPVFVHLTTLSSGGILNFSVGGDSVHKITLGSTGTRDYLINSGFFLDKIVSYPATLSVSLENGGYDDTDTCTLTNVLTDSAVFTKDRYTFLYGVETDISMDYYIISSNYTNIRMLDADGMMVNEQPNYQYSSADFPVSGSLDYFVSHGVLAAGNWSAVIMYSDGTSVVLDTAEVVDSTVVGPGYEESGSLVSDLTNLADLAGFEGPLGRFLLAVIFMIIASVMMFFVHFPVTGVLAIDILMFFALMVIGFIPILYMILFAIVAGLMLAAFIFRKSG